MKLSPAIKRVRKSTFAVWWNPTLMFDTAVVKFVRVMNKPQWKPVFFFKFIFSPHKLKYLNLSRFLKVTENIYLCANQQLIYLILISCIYLWLCLRILPTKKAVRNIHICQAPVPKVDQFDRCAKRHILSCFVAANDWIRPQQIQLEICIIQPLILLKQTGKEKNK